MAITLNNEEVAPALPTPEGEAPDAGNGELEDQGNGKGAADPKPEKAGEGEQEPADGKVEVDLENITKDEEGNLVFRVNPDDPSFGVFKGKDLNELLQNIAKGKADAEQYIRKLKSERKLSPDKYRGSAKHGEADIPDVQFPEFSEIVATTASKQGLDLKVFNWAREDWKTFEEENGAVETIELRQKMKDVQRIAEAQYAEENVAALNDVSLYEETRVVEELLQELDLDPDDFDYEDVLEKVLNDPKNFNKTGVRRTGRVVAEASRALYKLAADKVKKTTEKETKTKIAANARKKPGGSPVPSAAPLNEKVKVPASMQDAHREALEMLRAQRR